MKNVQLHQLLYEALEYRAMQEEEELDDEESDDDSNTEGRGELPREREWTSSRSPGA